MLQEVTSSSPDRWRELAELLAAPIIWIPSLQRVIIDFFAHSHSVRVAVAKFFFLLFPILLGLAAVWCTQLSLYTLPFRSRRIAFISTMLITWWDGARVYPRRNESPRGGRRRPASRPPSERWRSSWR